MSSNFRFPRVHITEKVVEGGTLYEQAVTAPVCDFCFDERVTWDYETDEYEVPEINFASAEGWAVCNTCAELVEARMRMSLVRRIMQSWRALGRNVTSQDAGAISLLVLSFFDHLRPGRKAFG